MKNIIYITFILLPIFGFTQKYGEVSFYLVDSLDVEIIAKEDLSYIDSVLNLYHLAKHDTLKIDLLGKIVEDIWDDNIWTKYNRYVLQEVNKLLYNKSKKSNYFLLNKKAAALGNIGFDYDTKGDPINAIKYYELGLQIQLEINDEKSAATSYSNIGYVYKGMGQIQKALEYYNKALKIQDKIGDRKGLAYSLNNIGMVFYAQEEYDAALDYYQKSLKIEEEIEDYYSIGNSLNNIAYIFEQKQQYDSVIYYYSEAIKLHERIRNTLGLGIVTNNLGRLYHKMNKYGEALEYYYQSVDYLNKVENPRVAGAYNNLANLFYDKNNISEAKKYGLLGLQRAQKSDAVQFIGEAASILSLIYKKEGKFQQSLEMYELFITMKDSLLNDDTKRAAIKQNLQYEYEKAALTDSLAFIEKQKIEQLQHQQELEQQKTYTIAGISGFVLMLVLVIVIFKGYSEKEKNNIQLEEKNNIITEQKNIVEEKNQEILDSINYAKRIQNAILPPQKVVKEYLQESFILYKPKDIVAGDFYWLEHKEDKVMFAACDCTGHGVPGAMVSVVCNNGLNRSVREYNLTDPGKILDKTREIVIQEFEKSEEEVKDGMDIALCTLQGNTLHYAGANNPLWIIRNNSEEIEEIKADKQPIGKYAEPTPYTTHKIELQKGDTIYIFSDGYADQFGGEKGKKFKAANFKKLLLSIQNESIEQQRELINQAFEDWKGDLEQLDDVCVIGVRI